jgi:polysaccharide export outer membrane protein
MAGSFGSPLTGDKVEFMIKAKLSGSWFVLVLACGLAVPAFGADTPSQAPEAKRDDYRVGAGDTLQVFVWKEPELSRDVVVRLDGRITVPLLGDVDAAGRTPEELGADIGAKLVRYVATPQVTVGVLRANSTHFYVIGQVGKPGEFPLTGPITLLQALALAGGFKDFAKTESIVIIRTERGAQTVLPVNYKKLEAGKDVSQNILLKPGDTIVVP